MAHNLLASLSVCNFTRVLVPSRDPISFVTSRSGIPRPVQCMPTSKISDSPNILRRSANYQPSIWHYDYIQSLKNEYVGESCTRQINNLKGQVRMMLHKVVDPFEQLELIDILQRLGLSYHFEGEIKRIIEGLYNMDDHGGDSWKTENLYATALKFRLLRQHGYDVSQVSHALEIPLHWRMLRLEARWFIDIYRRREDMNPILLELAELDFNMVQATHQEDLKQVSRWWKSTGLGEKLSFARDRLMENFLWTVGITFQPQFGYCRRMLTKVNALITTIDDVYDVYGTLDELELFTDAVERWDINAMDQLPDYMKICFLALHNSVNEMAFDTLKEQEFHIIRYLKKVWADLCRSYLLEAKWYYTGYTPTLQEYIENAWISISAPTILVHGYFFVTNPITKEPLVSLEEYPNIIRWSSLILRLVDDLGTSSDELERGDVPKSIQCYMNETGASEKDAREYIRCLIMVTWKKMNEERATTSPFSQTFIEIAMNLARMGQCMYQYGDGHGIVDRETKDRILSLLIKPIPLN
uniref:Uncharacterized protein n=1 Tax=Fagus sylvatica TaxID=28930 RepID=A0A2N9HUY7_FAGSY